MPWPAFTYFLLLCYIWLCIASILGDGDGLLNNIYPVSLLNDIMKCDKLCQVIRPPDEIRACLSQNLSLFTRVYFVPSSKTKDKMLHRQIFGIHMTGGNTRRVWHAFSSQYKSEVYDKHKFLRKLKQAFPQNGMQPQTAPHQATFYL